MTDESELKTKGEFFCGVVEGFYGRPWTIIQRKDLFQKMKNFGLNTYMYAPKDDFKHRAYWRELYSVEEAEQLTGLIQAAKKYDVEFVYALSPGLDITYSNPKEVACLKRKLEQVKQFGCEAFALLFDDIEPEISERDKEIFKSFGQAQVAITNEVYRSLGQPKLLFCPTEYCASRAVPNVQHSEYLNTIGSTLIHNIHVMWTGNNVISETITVQSIRELSEVLKRQPLIWDNVHANDYDQKRLFLGPYSGRSTKLIPHINGVLTNPNCEYESNFIAIHTLAQWSKCTLDTNGDYRDVNADIKLDSDGDGGSFEDIPAQMSPTTYHPRKALYNAINSWLPEFNRPKNAVESRDNKENNKKSMEEAEEPEVKTEPVECAGLIKQNQLTCEDLALLVDLFYLPFSHGKKGLLLLNEFQWIKSQSHIVSEFRRRNTLEPETQEVVDWYAKVAHFKEMTQAVGQLLIRLTFCNNRSLLYDIYPYISDIRGVLSLLNSYAKRLGVSNECQEASSTCEQEPWLFRGGLTGELERLLPLKSIGDLFLAERPESPSSRIYTIRPYLPSDETSVYEVCHKACNDFMQFDNGFSGVANLSRERFVASFLKLSSEYCLVVEDETGICGYVLAALDSQQFQKKIEMSWFAKLCTKNPSVEDKVLGDAKAIHENVTSKFMIPERVHKSYPSVIRINLLQHVVDLSVLKRVLACVLAALKANGSCGVFSKVTVSDQKVIDFYLKLGFREMQLSPEFRSEDETFLVKTI